MTDDYSLSLGNMKGRIFKGLSQHTSHLACSEEAGERGPAGEALGMIHHHENARAAFREFSCMSQRSMLPCSWYDLADQERAPADAGD